MDHATDFICWPNRDEYNAISENFQLPYTIGMFSDDINEYPKDALLHSFYYNYSREPA
jgi:hypothetical protein